jgi:peptidoglycan-associated lipoprotein
MKRFAILLILPLALGGACHKAKKKTARAAAPASQEIPTASGTPITTGDSTGDLSSSTTPDESPAEDVAPKPKGTNTFEPIYFAFDDATLSQEAMLSLDELGSYLEENPGAEVLITGHTDERGTDEYNLALSEERARVAKEYLARLQIDPARVKTVPYGEELPAEAGANEDAWSKNRRDEFTIVRETAQRD